jgi:hypothetical protein
MQLLAGGFSTVQNDQLTGGKAGLIDRTDRVSKGLFRPGLDGLKHVLKRGLLFDVHFFFQSVRLVGNVR